MRRWVSSPSYKAAVQVIVGTRKAAGLTQRALAARIGRPYTVIANIERGERRIDIVEFVAIARGIGIDEIELMRALVAALGPTLDL